MLALGRRMSQCEVAMPCNTRGYPLQQDLYRNRAAISLWSLRHTIFKETLRTVSVQLDHHFGEMPHGSWYFVERLHVRYCWNGYEHTLHFDNNTILLVPSYGKRTTNRRVVSFVKSVHVKQEILERIATRIFPFALSSSHGQKSLPRAESGGCFPTTLPALRTDLEIVRLLSRR